MKPTAGGGLRRGLDQKKRIFFRVLLSLLDAQKIPGRHSRDETRSQDGVGVFPHQRGIHALGQGGPEVPAGPRAELRWFRWLQWVGLPKRRTQPRHDAGFFLWEGGTEEIQPPPPWGKSHCLLKLRATSPATSFCTIFASVFRWGLSLWFLAITKSHRSTMERPSRDSLTGCPPDWLAAQQA